MPEAKGHVVCQEYEEYCSHLELHSHVRTFMCSDFLASFQQLNLAHFNSSAFIPSIQEIETPEAIQFVKYMVTNDKTLVT